jgi:hypothetical protein
MPVWVETCHVLQHLQMPQVFDAYWSTCSVLGDLLVKHLCILSLLLLLLALFGSDVAGAEVNLSTVTQLVN